MPDFFACVPESKGGVHQQLANLAVNVLDIRAVVAATVRVIRVVGILDFLCVSHAFKRPVDGLPKRGECVGGNRSHPAVGHRSVLSRRASWAWYAQQQPTRHSDHVRFAPSQSGDVCCAVCYTHMLHCATGPGRQLSDRVAPRASLRFPSSSSWVTTWFSTHSAHSFNSKSGGGVDEHPNRAGSRRPDVGPWPAECASLTSTPPAERFGRLAAQGHSRLSFIAALGSIHISPAYGAIAAMSAGPTSRPIGSVARSCARRASSSSPSSDADSCAGLAHPSRRAAAARAD